MVQLIAFLFFRSKGYYPVYDDGRQKHHPGCCYGLCQDTHDDAANTQQNYKDFSQSLQKPVDSLFPLLGRGKPHSKKMTDALARKEDDAGNQQEKNTVAVDFRSHRSEFPQGQNKHKGKHGTQGNEDQDFQNGNKEFSVAGNNFLYHLLRFKKKQAQ